MVAWPFILLLGLAPALAIELALGSMAHAPSLEHWRVRLAARSARVMALAVVVFAGANYAASAWNRKIDVSYFKTSVPSETTRTLVRDLGEPVRFVLFSPPGNEVMEQVESYLDDLAAAGPNAKIEVLDQAVDIEAARALKVTQNGALVLAKATQTETFQVGLEIESSRGKLKKLDREVQQRLLKLARPPRTVYFTSGHMERDWQPSATDKRLGLADLKTIVESLGLTVKRLGLGEGLGREIPKDAAAVVIAGPLEPFLPAERQALTTWLDHGGRLLALIDPDNGAREPELLAALGLALDAGLVASDRGTVRLEDRGDSPFIFATKRVSSHPSVTTLSQNTDRASVVLIGAGALAKRADAPVDLRITFTLHSNAEAWEDGNNNGKLDEGEKRGPRELAAAIERGGDAKSKDKAAPAMRAVVMADADLAGNMLVRNPGNTLLILDALKWLAGEETLAGAPTSEEDAPLVHKKDDDAVWFYGVSFLVPALVLGGGLVLSRRGGRRKAS
jgi:hypothetical protein